MMTQPDFEFITAYAFYVQAKNKSWAEETDIDQHWYICNGLKSLFEESKYNDTRRSFLGCVNAFMSNLPVILNIEKDFLKIKPGTWVELLDRSVVKVIAVGRPPEKKSEKNQQDFFIVFEGAEHKIEYYSIKGKNTTESNQYLSPKDIVKVINNATPEKS